jgi:Pyridoxamine 5'-phosphate oxidase
MGKFHDSIKPAHKAFIEKQHVFFVATAPLHEEGRINLSPKGLDCFKVMSEHEVGYMDLISSGNETSAHTLENGRIVIMFCAFNGMPNIIRLYGKAFTVLPNTPLWERYAPHFTIYPSTRQLIIANIDLVQTSCGFGVPTYEYIGERDVHFRWAESKGVDGLNKYMLANNVRSLDGLPTQLSLNLV